MHLFVDCLAVLTPLRLVGEASESLNGLKIPQDCPAVHASKLNRESAVPFISFGLDGSDDAAEYIKKGQLVGTALQQIAGITELAVEQADAYVTDGTKPETEKQLVPCVAITAENVEFLSAFVYTGE